MPPTVDVIERPSSSAFLLDTERFAPANRRQVSGPGLRTFLAITDLWGLTESERLLILGGPSRSTYYGWLKAARDGRDLILLRKHGGVSWWVSPRERTWVSMLRGHVDTPYRGFPRFSRASRILGDTS